MIRTAIVEDEDSAVKILTSFLTRFGEEQGESFHVTRFTDPVALLDRYPGFDLVFMDIRMPNMDGMKGARLLRERDRQVKLVFITSMAQYAAKGYEVDATDFIIKPVAYPDFCFKMKRVMNSLRIARQHDLMIPQSGGMVRIRSDELTYVEVRGHKLTWHLLDRVLESRGSIASAEEVLAELSFLRPHNSFLINPKHIDWVRDFTVSVAGEELMISHPRKKEFMADLTIWYARGGI